MARKPSRKGSANSSPLWAPRLPARRGEGRRAGTFGSLLLGAYDQRDRLRFLGHVGTGFTERMLGDLLDRLGSRTIPASPYDDEVPRMYARKATWVRPDLVGEVVGAIPGLGQFL